MYNQRPIAENIFYVGVNDRQKEQEAIQKMENIINSSTYLLEHNNFIKRTACKPQ